MRIGVTGKIGAGKSSLSQALATALAPEGYALLDVDALTALVHLDPAFQATAQALFGSLDRGSMSRACFADPAKLAALERASLPIWAALLRSGLLAPNLIVDFPLLLETQLGAPSIDLAIGVSAPDAKRQARACSRLGWEPERFAAVDALQMGQRSKMSFCDIEAANDGTPRQLELLSSQIAAGVRDLDHIKPRVEPLVGPAAWRMVARAHMQPHRRYHGPAHLRSLFASLDLIAPQLSGDASCALAIAYHDFVYDTGSAYHDNERLSARALSGHARDLFPHLLALPDPASGLGPVALACAMVDSTHGHRILDPWLLASPARMERAQAFLDADLAILGSGTDAQFWAYDDGIGQEFASVPRPAYHGLRAQAMASFANPLERPALYLTPAAQAWEPAARRRLAELVDKHQRLATPGANQKPPP